MKFHTIVNFPGGVQVDFGQRERYRHEQVIKQGPRDYKVDTMNIRDGVQTLNLRRA